MWGRKAASQAAAMRERSDLLLLDASQYENDGCDYVKGDFVCDEAKGVAPAAGVACLAFVSGSRNIITEDAFGVLRRQTP
jgi:hypothetical protein